MAFDAGSGKYFFQMFYAGSPANIKHWMYVTTDAPTTVDGSAYITDQEVIDKTDVGDLIWVYQVASAAAKDDLGKGITDISLHAVLVNSGTTVDLSNDLLGATVTYGD